jgi:hypothetical protein
LRGNYIGSKAPNLNDSFEEMRLSRPIVDSHKIYSGPKAMGLTTFLITGCVETPV